MDHELTVVVAQVFAGLFLSMAFSMMRRARSNPSVDAREERSQDCWGR